MQLIISPAKQMRASETFAALDIPPFPHKTAAIVEELRRIEREEGTKRLQRVWGVSDALLRECLADLSRLEVPQRKDQLGELPYSRILSPALFAYHGVQYQAMAPEVLDQRSLEWLGRHLWILSGLYGAARSFDAVAPYRLELGARLAVDGAPNLYRFWGPDVAGRILREEPCVLNLASAEYARAVLPHMPESSCAVTCIFGEELRDGHPIQRSVASKKARGSMVRWLAEQQAATLEVLPMFDVGYTFRPDLSSTRHKKGRATEHVLVFMKRERAS